MSGHSPPRLVDAHCHLDFNAFAEDLDEVMARGREQGLVRLLNPGIDLQSSRAAVKLANKYSEVYAAIGIHPNEASTWDEHSLAELESLASQPKVTAIGEIGLDYYRDRAPRELQLHVLQAQLEIAGRLSLPVIIHNRQAAQDLLPLLGKWQEGLRAQGSRIADRPGVLHSFSEDAQTATRVQALGFYIGITGPVTFSNSAVMQDVAAHSELERMLIETDAPFLTPEPWRGKRNEPAYVTRVAQKIAELRGMAFELVAEITTANAERLFDWRVTG